jgi:CHAD domain-containing protein
VTGAEISQNAGEVLANSPPRIRIEDFSKKKLSARWTKVATRLNRRIVNSLPIVLSDANRVNELHALRRDIRKLRYLLTFAKKDKRISQLEDYLIKMQDVLGAIRDCDIAIRCLMVDHEARVLEEPLLREVAKREVFYRQFVSAYSSRGIRRFVSIVPLA